MWRRRRPSGLPDGWREVTAARLAHYAVLDDDERAALGERIEWLLDHRRWEAVRGFSLTDEMRITIAAQAALLILALDVDAYVDVQSIIVMPRTRTLSGPRPGPVAGVMTDEPMVVDGLAHDRRGPILLAWDSINRETRHPGRGHNVVFHEFAHKLDMLDGTIDGTPPIRDAAMLERWIEVFTAEFDRVHDGTGGHLLRPYAGTDPGEFFAVATEVFFDRPLDLRHEKGELYDLLAEFYRQDPAERLSGRA